MKVIENFILIGTLLIVQSRSVPLDVISINKTSEVCSLSESLIQEIDSYEEILNKIVTTTVNGSFKGFTWEELGIFADKFGSRFSGTERLEKSIDYMLEKSKNHSLENVHGELAMIPHWVRGLESAKLISPWHKDIALLGLGYSVATPKRGIMARAIVVKTFDELQQRANEIPGRIVVYNQDFESYSQAVKYRLRGASEAAKLGAVAVLIRSITPVSLYTPHTGIVSYAENVTKIPAACITVEDAELLYRLQNRGEILKIHLKMQAKTLPDVESRNVVIELTGSSEPEKIVVVSGHIDSWDVGQGVMDDAGGTFISWASVVLLKKLNLRPKRTIRVILWNAKEMGIIGANQYIRDHDSETENLQFVMESDMGTFQPLGLVVSGNDEVFCILKKVLSLLNPLGNLDAKRSGGTEGLDIKGWIQKGIPGASLWNQNDKYFSYHHTNADTMLLADPPALDAGTALFAAVSYVMADISSDISLRNTKITDTQ